MSKPKQHLTISASDMLGDFKLTVEALGSMPKTTETVLVAPNKRIAAEWREMYPGIKVILQEDYKGYPSPTAATKYLGIQPIEKDGK